MTEGVFDPQAFLTQQTDGTMDTRFDPVEVGDYTAVITKVDTRQFQGTKDPSKTYTSMDVTWDIESPEQKAKLGRDTLSVRQSIFLDLNGSGGLDTGKGKNVQLGRLREATGLNTPGRPFTPNDLIGKMAKVNVIHRPGPNDDIFAEVKAVAKM
jgi:hypothetical protein